MTARATVLFLLAAAGAQAGVVSHSWLAGKLSLQLDDGSATLEWISPAAFRFERRWDPLVREMPAIAHDPVLVALEEEGGVLRTRTRYINVEVVRSTAELRVGAGEAALANLSMSRGAGAVEARFSPFEKVFGGALLPRQNGLLFTNNGYGLYFRSPEPHRFDLEKGTVQARGARSMEFVFYYGPSPKEILEQHQVTTGAKEATGAVLPLLGAADLPAEATPLPAGPIETWESFARLVADLNNWSLSGVLYPALDLAVADQSPDDVKQRVADLAALLPIVYRSKAGSATFDQATRDAFKPYFLTYLREAFDRGYPLIRPLHMQFSRDAEMDRRLDLFMLGDEFLLAPVLGPGEKRRVALPRGLWTDLRTNTEYRGNQTVEIEAPAGRVPMLTRNGSLFPLAAAGRMELHYVPSLGGEYFQWEPDVGENSQFHAAPAGDFMRVEIESKVRRTYEWVVHHTGAPRRVEEDSGALERVGERSQLRPGNWWHDSRLNNLHILLRVEEDTDRIVNISF